MSEATPLSDGSVAEQIEQPEKTPLLADPVVRVMLYVMLALVILALATVVGVMATGIAAPTGPRSVAERDLAVASARLSSGNSSGQSMAPYVEALIGTGDLGAARLAMAQARASIQGTESVTDLDLAEARLFTASGKYEDALRLAEKAMKGYTRERDTRAKTTKKSVYEQNYYAAALVKAYALVELGRWKDAVASFDIYLKIHPTASDILIDRGKAKIQLKDKAGAEKDFRTALKYVPYDPEAKAQLKRIGVEK